MIVIRVVPADLSPSRRGEQCDVLVSKYVFIALYQLLIPEDIFLLLPDTIKLCHKLFTLTAFQQL